MMYKGGFQNLFSMFSLPFVYFQFTNQSSEVDDKQCLKGIFVNVKSQCLWVSLDWKT